MTLFFCAMLVDYFFSLAFLPSSFLPSRHDQHKKRRLIERLKHIDAAALKMRRETSNLD